MLRESILNGLNSGLNGNLRLIKLQNDFKTTLPGNDLTEIINLAKNSFFKIDNIHSYFEYANTVIPSATYFTNSLNYSGSFILKFLHGSFDNELFNIFVQIKDKFKLSFEDLIFDSNAVSSLKIVANNDSFISFKENTSDISATIDEIRMTILLTCYEYPKDYFKMSGNKILSKI